MKEATDQDYAKAVVHGDYYPHIDGIRALAVIPVVLFHVLATLCPGGFVGVDVFFVISGYLITSGILRDLKNGRFSIRSFYHRRIRRIMPAYFAMILVVFVTGCLIYYAKPLVTLSESAITSTLFLENLRMWRLGGDYFETEGNTQPLMHLWSLSVEEQFYLIIPLLCFLVWRCCRRMIGPILALLTVISASSAIYLVMNGHSKDAFYFFHYRAWELLMGSLLAMIPSPEKAPALKTQAKEGIPFSGSIHTVSHARKHHNLLASAGLLMVFGSYLLFSDKTPFPGLSALPAVIGTALLIRYGHGGPTAKLLSWRPIISTGKISYSLYLWHWPIIVFWKYATYDQLHAFDHLGMIALSMIFAYLSWKYIEIPSRTGSFFTMGRSFAFATSGIGIIIFIALACISQKGWPKILHPGANQISITPEVSLLGREGGIRRKLVQRLKSIVGSKQFSNVPKTHEEGPLLDSDGQIQIGFPGKPRMLLIGDSHAGSIRYGFDSVLRSNRLPGYAIIGNNEAMFDMTHPDFKVTDRILKSLPANSVVILAQRWIGYNWRDDPTNGTQSSAPKLIAFASHVKTLGLDIMICCDVPNHKYSLCDIIVRTKIISPREMEDEWKSLRQSDETYQNMQASINKCLEEVCRKTGATLVPLQSAFQSGNGFDYSERDSSGQLSFLYRDSHHLSKPGSLRAANFIMAQIPSDKK